MKNKCFEIIDFFYKPDDPARDILLKHSIQVRDKALAIAEKFPEADKELIFCGAMLHDIGIRFCNAPDIGCYGADEYIMHGILGGAYLDSLDLPCGHALARICERHTGSGITAAEIMENNMPLPVRDLMPETLEEKIICLADKFFSKSADMKEKNLDSIRKGMEKFGAEPLKRFDALYLELS